MTNSGSKKPDDKPDLKENWENVRMTSTKTEVITNTSAADDLLNRGDKFDPALIAIQGDMLGRVFRLKEGANSIGRQTDNMVVINQRAISGRHASIKLDGENVILEDLQSTNGTILNTKRIDRPMLLQQDDVIKIGSSVFKYTENNLDTAFTESLHQKGTVDELTGVYNKAYIIQALAQAIEVAKGGFPLSIVMFDLDHFKKVNDTYGHLAGDYVLSETCRLVKESVIRSEDILGRFGGEEFVLVMPDAKLEVAVGVAERVRTTIEGHSFEFSDKIIPVRASLGVTTWRPAIKSPDDFLEEVDQLLYKSKEGGRNMVSH